MQARNPSEEQLWDVCQTFDSDWEPHGKRKWPGRPEDRPDCSTCRWFVELFHRWPAWGSCANPDSPRGGLLTFYGQGCWHHEPGERPRQHLGRCVRCGFKDWFERFLRENAAEFIKEQIQKANNPSGEGEPATKDMRKTPLFVALRCLLRHADEGFRRPAFDAMVATARRDTRRYWTFARCYWSRAVGEDLSIIRLPENMRELENEFWQRIDATIGEALRGRELKPTKKHRSAN